MLIVYWLPDERHSTLCEDPSTGDLWLVPNRRDGWETRRRYPWSHLWTPDRYDALDRAVANVILALVGAPHDPVTLEQCRAYVDEITRCHAGMARIDRRQAERVQSRTSGPSDADRAAVASIQARIAELARGVA